MRFCLFYAAAGESEGRCNRLPRPNNHAATAAAHLVLAVDHKTDQLAAAESGLPVCEEYKGGRRLSDAIPMNSAGSHAWNYDDRQINRIGGGNFQVSISSTTKAPSLVLQADKGLTWHQYVFALTSKDKYLLNADSSCQVTIDIKTVTAASVAMVE